MIPNAVELERLEREAIRDEAGLEPDPRHARVFIAALTGSEYSPVTFQIFDDNPTRKDGSLARVLHGTLQKHGAELGRLNRKGAGVFITVNETDLRGRKAENIIALRALVADFDAGAPASYALDPSYIVQSARGPQPYWLLERGVPLPRFRPAQLQVAAFYGSDSSVADLPRVMRLPGFFHQKGVPFLVTFEGRSLRRYALRQVLSAHPVKGISVETIAIGPAPTLPEVILEGEGRDNSLASIAGTLRRRGMNESEIFELLKVPNKTRCRPPLPETDLARIAKSIATKPPGEQPVQRMTPSYVKVANLVKLSSVTRKKVEWLWRGRIARGKITDLFGDGDLGKSTLLTDLAARITRGRGMPDEHLGPPHDPRTVIVLTAEDGIDDTLKARFDEAGGDGDRLEVLTSVTQRDGTRDMFSLSQDIEALVDACSRTEAALCTIDPFSAFLGSADGHKDQEVRRVLGALKEGVEPIGTAVILLRHPPKGRTENPMHAAGGSVAISAACRTGMMVMKDSEDPERRLLATYKNNLTKEMPTLAFRLKASPSDMDTAIVEWESGTDPRSARQLLVESGQSYEQRSALGDARAFLKDILSEGPQEAAAVKAEARKLDISIATLRRACTATGVQAAKTGLVGPWTWRLP